jgi:two-component system chemotaxis response regulator CheB
MSDTGSESGAAGGNANPAEAPRPVVVAIGVSQDGVSALQRVLAPFQESLKAVVLVVRHTTPTRPSLLPLVLGRVIKLPVKEAVGGEPLEAGVVYVAPSDLHLTVVDGRAGLSAGPKVSFTRPSVDVLFESVARVCGARAVGVLLSGGGRDGAAGLASIRRAGGGTIVQDPDEAVSASMPRAALALDGHRVARIDDIPEALRLALAEASRR